MMVRSYSRSKTNSVTSSVFSPDCPCSLQNSTCFRRCFALGKSAARLLEIKHRRRLPRSERLVRKVSMGPCESLACRRLELHYTRSKPRAEIPEKFNHGFDVPLPANVVGDPPGLGMVVMQVCSARGDQFFTNPDRKGRSENPRRAPHGRRPTLRHAPRQ